MAQIFGIANHSPEYVIDALRKAKLIESLKNIGIVPSEQRLSRRTSCEYLLLLSTKDLRRNASILATSKYQNVRVFVFANPMDLSEIEGLTALDYESNPEYPGFGFKLKAFNVREVKKASESRLEYRRGRYLHKLIKYVKRGSLLNPLMTYLYTLPSSTNNFVKIAVAKWFMSGKPNKSLLAALDKEVSDNVRNRLSAILFNEVGDRFKLVFARIRENGLSDLKAAAKEHQVSDYEIRYLLSVLSNSESGAGFESSFDRARNRKRS